MLSHPPPSQAGIMVRSFLTGGGNNSAVQYFDIRPDNDHIIFRGPPTLSAGTPLRGTLVLCNTEPLKVNDITMRLTGTKHTSITIPTAMGMSCNKQDTEFLRFDWKFDFSEDGRATSGVLPAGNHEWPFEMNMSSALPESVEGSFNNWIAYRLKATIDRGIYAKNIDARHHIRVIRTVDSDSLELMHGSSVSNTWPEKVSYEVTTPQKAVMFGSTVVVQCDIVPLVKGLKIGQVNTSFVEHSNITVDTGELLRRRQFDRVVASDNYKMPEHAETEDIDGAEGYRISRELSLPRTFRHCLQSVETESIAIKHWLKCFITLLNPDGHYSELRVQLPIIVYIPPHVTINEQHELSSALPIRNHDDETMNAPPLYGDHHQDTLYTDVDPRVYYTPGPSQLPSRIQSRRGSEDLNRTPGSQDQGQVCANNLQERLAGLGANNSSEGTSPANTGESLREGGYFSNHGLLTPGSSAMSRSASGETGADPSEGPIVSPDHEHVEWQMDALSRVPSYHTAVHSTVHSTQSICNSLPNYMEVTSGPPSPQTPEDCGNPFATDSSRQMHAEQTGDRHRPRFALPGRGSRRQISASP